MNRLAACEHCGEDVWYDDRADQWHHNDGGDHEARPDEYDETLAERDAHNESADSARGAFELKHANQDQFIGCPYCGAESYAGDFADGHCPVCGKANYELDSGPYNRLGSINPGRTPVSSNRIAAIEFVAAENTTNREELLFRAHRHASNLTCQLPVPVAQRVVQEFVATVNREAVRIAACSEDGPCEGCNAEAGEECRPWCTGKAKYDDEKADKKRKKSHRTAAVSDFPDELMY